MSSTLAYLTVDPLDEGVGSSQVVPYVERFAAAGVRVTLHSFEHRPPSVELAGRLAAAGIDWRRHPWGRPGPHGGVARVLRAAAAIRGAELVHARGDLVAAAASLERGRPFVWDMRAFFRAQRIDQGSLRRGGPEDRVLRRLEQRLSRTAAGIVTLAEAARPALASRFGAEAARRAIVVPTCVDLARFSASPLPTGPIDLGLVGTLNRLYDVPAAVALVAAVRRHREATLTVVAPGPTPWDEVLRPVTDRRLRAEPAEMPDVVRELHVGLSVLDARFPESAVAAMPTKIGEFLASGRPVVVSARLGDMDAVIDRFRCGVVLRDPSAAGIAAAAGELCELLADDDLAGRCRAAAEAHFDVDVGVARLLELYDSVRQP